MKRKIQKRFNQAFQHKKGLNKTYFLEIKQKLTLSSLGETLPIAEISPSLIEKDRITFSKD
jgi:hypothetical protein